MRLSLLIILVTSLLFFSCTTETKPGRELLPGCIGRSGQVVVVMTDSEWNGIAGQVVRDALYQSYLLLPQHEPLFDIIHKTPGDFMEFYKEHRSVILANIRDNINNQEVRTKVIREMYAKNQVVVEVIAPNIDSFISEFRTKEQSIIDRLYNAELDRLQLQQGISENKNLIATVKGKFGVDMSIPTSYAEVMGDENFSWIKKNWDQRNPELEKALIIYKYPYVSDSTFTPAYLLNQRDSILGKVIKGSHPDTYMATEYFYDPSFRIIDLDGEYAAELKGLWKIQGAFLGGPFASISFLNKEKTEVLTVEGYVFAPHEDKREHMRTIEAVIKSAGPA